MQTSLVHDLNLSNKQNLQSPNKPSNSVSDDNLELKNCLFYLILFLIQMQKVTMNHFENLFSCSNLKDEFISILFKRMKKYILTSQSLSHFSFLFTPFSFTFTLRIIPSFIFISFHFMDDEKNKQKR